MNKENFNRACQLRQQISILNTHKKVLESVNFHEIRGDLTFSHDYFKEIMLSNDFIPVDFQETYMKNINDEIEKLELEFKNL